MKYQQFSLYNYSINDYIELEKNGIKPHDSFRDVYNKIVSTSDLNNKFKNIDNSCLFQVKFNEVLGDSTLLLYLLQNQQVIKPEFLKYLLHEFRETEFMNPSEVFMIGAYLCAFYDKKLIEFWLNKYNNLKDYRLNFETEIEFFYPCSKAYVGRNGFWNDNMKLTRINLMYACLFNKEHGVDNIIYLCKEHKFKFWDSLNMLYWGLGRSGISFDDLEIVFKDIEKFKIINVFDKYSVEHKNIEFYRMCDYLSNVNENILSFIFNSFDEKKYYETTLYLNSLCSNYKLNKIKEVLEILPYEDLMDSSNNKLNCKYFTAQIEYLCLKFPKGDKEKRLKIAIIRVMLEKLISILKTDNERKICLDSVIRDKLNSIASSKYSLRIFKILSKYNINFHEKDSDGFTPLLDAAKYGDFHTFKYLFMKTPYLLRDITNRNVFKHFNIISASCMNGDFRILKYICENKHLYPNTIYDEDTKKNCIDYLFELYPFKIDDDRDNMYCHKEILEKKTLKKNKYLLNRIKLLHESFDLTNQLSIILTKCKNIYVANKVLDILGEKCPFTLEERYENCDRLIYLSNIHILRRLVKQAKLCCDPDYELVLLLNSIIPTKKLLFSEGCQYLLNIIDPSYIKRYSSMFFKNLFNIHEDDILEEILKKSILLLKKKGFDINNNRNVDFIKNRFRYIEKNTVIIDTLILCGLNIYRKEFVPRQNAFAYHNDGIFGHNYITVWCKCLHYLRLYVKRRMKKFEKIHKSDISQVNHEIRFYPNIDSTNNLYKNLGIDFKKNFNIFEDEFCDTGGSMTKKPCWAPPKHSTPENLYKSMNNNNIITQKIDGVTSRGLEGIKFYPDLGEILNNKNISLQNLEAEYVESENMYYIIDSYHDNIDIMELNMYLRKNHLYLTMPQNIDGLNTLDLNKFNNFMKEEDLQKTSYRYEYNKYINDNQNNDDKVALWWPKKMWIADKGIDLLKQLEKIKDIKVPIYPTDGWILTNINNRDSIKIKPDYHITVDLLYANNFWKNTDDIINNIELNESINYKENKIYRCYFDKDSRCWIPKEERTDKKKPNNKKIYDELYNYHVNPWLYSDLISLIENNSPYYQVDNFNRNKFYEKQKKEDFKEIKNDWINKLENKDILDLGSGFKTNKILKDINYESYVGIDLDYDAFLRKNDNLKIRKLLLDFTQKWDNNKNGVIKNLNQTIGNKKFDTILSINTIHYAAKSNESWNIFIDEITKRTKQHGQIFINFLDKDMLEKLFCNNDKINFNSSFVRECSEYINHDVCSLWIKIYYEWCHINPLLEPVLSFNIIRKSFEKRGWRVISYKYNNLDSDIPWINYMKCFSKLIMEYKPLK